MSERFGTLRALLQQAPSLEVWWRLCEELKQWGEEEREHVALPYATEHLARWPARVSRWSDDDDPVWLRQLANGCLVQSVEGALWWAPRCRHLRVDDAQVVGHLERFDQLITLSLRADKLGEEATLTMMRHAWPASLRELLVDGLLNQSEDARRRIVEALAGNASWAGLEVLNMSMGGLDPASMEALAQSPHLSQLRELHLGSSVLGVAGARALAQSPYLRRLHTLALPSCRMDAASARVLAGSPVLETVTRLDVSTNPLREGLAALLGSPYTRGLTTLGLRGVSLDEAGGRALCEVEWPPGLDGFDLSSIRCDRHTFDALAGAPILRLVKRFVWDGPQAEQPMGLMASPHLTGLRWLELSNADEAVIEAAKNPALSGLETLIIVTREQTARCCAALSQSAFRAGLQRLEVSASRPGIGALCEGEPWGSLRHLKLGGLAPDRIERGSPGAPSVTDADIELLARSETLRTLETLVLGGNMLSDMAALALADSGMLGELRMLELRSNQIGDMGMIALIERAGMHKLEALLMYNNRLGDVSAAVIASDAVTPRVFSAFAKGGLDANRIGLLGVRALLRSPHIGAVEELRLSGNLLSHQDIVALAQDPALADLRGTLKLGCEDAREQTWQALIDSPYASEGTRDYAARLLEIVQRKAQRGRG